MLSRILNADGLTYIVLKAARDFAVVFAGLVTVDGFVLSQDSMTKAAIAAGTITVFRFVREVLSRFEVVPEAIPTEGYDARGVGRSACGVGHPNLAHHADLCELCRDH